MKKLIIIFVAVVLLLVVAGAAAFVMLAGGGDDEEDSKASAAAAKVPPTFVPLDTMVVNLADPGGDRFAQLGITLELSDPKVVDQLKSFMPAIRSNVLLLVSQRTSDELLTREGKEKLAADVLVEVSRPLGFRVPKPRKRSEDDEEDDDDRPRARANPVRKVLFSSFIVQ